MKNNRRYQRIKLAAEVSYKHDKNPSLVSCLAKDISEGGIKITLLEFLAIGTILELQFKLPLLLKIFIVRGKVVWIKKLPYNERWEAGVDLIIDKNSAALIRQYVLSKS